MEISDGTIDITASDEGLNAAGGNDQSGMDGFGGDMFSADEDAWITISGGTVTIDATGDGIDSNGDLTVSGGNIFVSYRAITEMVLWITMERRRSPGNAGSSRYERHGTEFRFRFHTGLTDDEPDG